MTGTNNKTKQAWGVGLALTLAFTAGACTSGGAGGDDDDVGRGGDGGGNAGGEGGDNAGGEGGPGSGGDGGAVQPPPGVDACGPLPPAPARRLSRVEYMATVRELFPHAFTADADGVYRLDNHQFTYQRPGYPTPPANATDGEKAAYLTKRHLRGDVLPDPNTYGFENRANNLNPTPSKIEDFDELALLLSEYLTLPGTLAKTSPCTDQTVACGKKMIDALAPRFYRRPLVQAEKDALYKFFEDEFTAAQAEEGVDAFVAATRLTLEALLQAPAFLYRFELGDPESKAGAAIKLTQHEVANRLSYLFWSSMPDAELMAAADNGELETAAQLEAQARRMLGDKRFRFMAIEFFRQWGDFERIFAESYRQYPGRSLGELHTFPVFMLLGARREAEMLAEWIMADHDGNFGTMLSTTKSWTNKYTKALYSGSLLPIDTRDPDSNYVETELNPQQRAGFLTRAFFNWSYSHFGTPNPPIRGSFIMSKVLCRHLGAPPADAMSLAGAVKFTAGMTNREQFEARIRDAAKPGAGGKNICQQCHDVMDPLGFAFENYNEFGMYLSKDAKNPSKNVDASGTFTFETDVDGQFANGVELSKRMADSADVRRCMTTQWYEYMTGRTADGSVVEDTSGPDQCRLKALDEAVSKADGDLREAMVEYVKSADFQWRPAY